LLKNIHDGPAAAAVELFASLLAYGEGVVIVEQIPSKILPDVIKNTAFKVMHRLPARDDRDAVGATMNLTELNSEAVVLLPPAIAAVSVDGGDRPLLIGADGGVRREQPTNANLVPPLRGKRSSLCGANCQASACTLAQMDDAPRTAEHPTVVVWTEAVTAALILGRRPPPPRQVVLDQWTADSRYRDCALATLADRAIDARRTDLAPWVAPDDFAAHLKSVLRALTDGHDMPEGEPGRWRAGAYRWGDAYGQLRAAVDSADDAATSPPHPNTAQWRSIGLHLEAPNLAGQFEELRNKPAYAHGSELVLFGDTTTSGLHAALEQLAGTTTVNGLTRAIRFSCAMPPTDPLLRLLERRFPALTTPGPRGQGVAMAEIDRTADIPPLPPSPGRTDSSALDAADDDIDTGTKADTADVDASTATNSNRAAEPNEAEDTQNQIPPSPESIDNPALEAAADDLAAWPIDTPKNNDPGSPDHTKPPPVNQAPLHPDQTTPTDARQPQRGPDTPTDRPGLAAPSGAGPPAADTSGELALDQSLLNVRSTVVPDGQGLASAPGRPRADRT
jgi:hypothetical protein